MNKRPITPADLFEIQEVSDPQLSPNGKWIVFVMKQANSSNKNISNIYLVSTEGGEPRRLTNGDSDSVPRWSPDGQWIAFKSSREDKPQIWLIPVDGGEAKQLTQLKRGLSSPMWGNAAHAWSPDGKWIAFLSEGDEEIPERTAADDMTVIDRVFYKRSGGGFREPGATHIWTTSVTGDTVEQITDSDWDDHSITWSPDGKRIAFISNRTDDPDNNANNDLFVVDVTTHAVRQLTNTPGPEFQPAWSPDGGRIAYIADPRGNDSKDSPNGDTHVWTIHPDGSGPTEVSAELDQRCRAPAWSADGHWIYFLATEHGATRVFRVKVEGGAVEPVTEPEQWVESFSLSDTQITYAASDFTMPGEIFVTSLQPESAPQQVTHMNRNWLTEIKLGDVEHFTCRSHDDLWIEGWLIKPPFLSSEERAKYPAVLWIHGGPHSTFGYRFRIYYHILAAQGYGVMLINPRGSTGYGQAFVDGCLNDWGGEDYQDLMAGVDDAVSRFKWIDPDRLGVMGGSYGGYMTNWIITQTDRFKAAVSDASVSNLHSFYGTSMFQLLVESQFGGYPWERAEILWERSPMKHIANAKTPTLFTHGEGDNDVHITQSEEIYMALKKRSVPTRFVRYPREGHGFSEPLHRKDWIERVIDWFDTYLK
ncbi:MAG: S9 family peptidase [Candidatus Poribacteria bacterium]|nr:S9 family peptidase [Candidatus Poribacteria bacterium]